MFGVTEVTNSNNESSCLNFKVSLSFFKLNRTDLFKPTLELKTAISVNSEYKSLEGYSPEIFNLSKPCSTETVPLLQFNDSKRIPEKKIASPKSQSLARTRGIISSKAKIINSKGRVLKKGEMIQSAKKKIISPVIETTLPIFLILVGLLFSRYLIRYSNIPNNDPV